jgi:RNA polymerase sigma-70 factor (ECF subfamily)
MAETTPAGPAPRARTSALRVDEDGLVRRVAAGDRAAFDALYIFYFPRVSRFVERMVRRPHLVSEIVNDTMFVVWQKASSFNGQSKVSTWILAIAYRTALKAVGRRGEPAGESAGEEAAVEATPEQELMLLQDRRILDEALRQLSAEHRAVVELAYYQDCTCREVAQVIGCPVDTVKTRLFHARRKLRALLTARREELL